MSGQISTTLLERLADQLARPVSEAERRRACLHVLDWTGCAIAGANSKAGQSLTEALAGEAGGVCRIIGQDRLASPLSAALLNGAIGNVLEMDDVDKRAILHPGPTVIPAALAAAQQVEASAEAFLDAVVRGYEAVIRIGRAVGPGHYRFWHNTGTCGPFGAAAAAASLFGLKGRAFAHALALAGTQASGFWQTRHEAASQAKQLHTARAAHAGVLAAQLAASEFKGPLSLLEGEQGFFAATCPAANANDVCLDYGPDWLIHSVSIKPWGACRHAHAAIDAALECFNNKVSAKSILAVEVETYRDAVVFCDRPEPTSTIEAKFSLQHSVAVTLLNGPPELADFEPDAFQASDVRELAAKIHVTSSPRFDERYPAHYGAGLIVKTKQDETINVEVPDALGDPENPLSDGQIEAKFMTLCQYAGMDVQAAHTLLDKARTLDTADSLTDYLCALPTALPKVPS